MSHDKHLSGCSSSSVLYIDCYYAPVEVRSIVINSSVCLCVCVSVCPRAYLWNRWTDRHEILAAVPLWPWLPPPLTALRYVMYFRFYGWRYVWPYWARLRNVEAAPCSDGHERRGDSGAESDVYECLFVLQYWQWYPFVGFEIQGCGELSRKSYVGSGREVSEWLPNRHATLSFRRTEVITQTCPF